ncbi:putative lysine methyltransferase [Septoria linicola]|nr:putative lysine methyltransferase [Septoria linicola]
MSSNSRPFPVKSDSLGNTIPIQIGELPGIVAENLGLATWGAAVVLADVLHRWTPEIKKTITNDPELQTQALSNTIAILELGAGTGLAGLTASALWSLPAVLTDLEPVIPGIQHNITLNPSLPCHAGALDWTSPSTLNLSSPSSSSPTTVSSSQTKASLILAADTCYTSSHPLLITSTVSHWLAPSPHSRAIFCYPLRTSYIEHARNLWSEMQAAGFVCIEEGREEARELWGEIGPIPYEWSTWGWREFHQDAVRREEEERRAIEEGGGGWLAM